ncbi:hypothetical protein CCOS865_00355 [Pseudomonas reidholzensis]|uniref:Uncharacterized protein n=1 Tax=Pseudomonas reidholzensis TaxID=1785162 RepID=A0A383RN03_9PSED|nr:hypothetical protein [Pseudomonas reidholzensis]SYX88133.1 hypothetical protein CCOS865_00355 [Pseudomonas reidholzensis]
MYTDDEIYQGLGETVRAIAPTHAQWVSVDVELSEQGDHAKLLYDFQVSGGEVQWFMPETARVDHDIRVLLVKLRSFFAANNLFENGKPWKRCLITLWLDSGKFSADFKYD